MASQLRPILTLARSGAISRAWEAFLAVGQDATSSVEALTVKGRLLKDRARQAVGAERRALFVQSAQAYADAAALRPDSYPLINAATMSLFGGQADDVASLAHETLALLDTGTAPGETPYWHDATQAEALLLLGQREEAEAALRAAIVHAPQAWEDHATTLRQFRAILDHRNEAHDWLLAYAPPKSIYFKGMMGIADNDRHAADAIAALVAKSGAGFAFGALAAGADLLIAEAVVGARAELHIILPVAPAVFRARSVEPYGKGWSARFDALLEQAASIEVLDDSDRLSSAAVEMAAEVAKGRAIDNAARMESEAIALQIVDNDSGPVAMDIQASLRLNRSATPGKSDDLESRQTAFLLATSIDADLQEFDRHGECAIASTSSAESSARLMRQLRNSRPDATIAVHATVADENGYGNAAIVQIDRLLRAAAPGTVIATATATMMLKAAEPALWIEPLGELPDPAGALTIYALRISI